MAARAAEAWHPSVPSYYSCASFQPDYSPSSVTKRAVQVSVRPEQQLPAIVVCVRLREGQNSAGFRGIGGARQRVRGGVLGNDCGLRAAADWKLRGVASGAGGVALAGGRAVGVEGLRGEEEMLTRCKILELFHNLYSFYCGLFLKTDGHHYTQNCSR